RIVLMGASMGGAAVIVTAAHLGDKIAGVIDLSGPAEFAGMNALSAARRVHVPALFGYGTFDLGFAADVRHLRAATAAPDKPIVAVKTLNPGVPLADPELGSAKMREAVLRFIRGAAHGCPAGSAAASSAGNGARTWAPPPGGRKPPAAGPVRNSGCVSGLLRPASAGLGQRTPAWASVAGPVTGRRSRPGTAPPR